MLPHLAAGAHVGIEVNRILIPDYLELVSQSLFCIGHVYLGLPNHTFFDPHQAINAICQQNR
jgi:hypothetical protein